MTNTDWVETQTRTFTNWINSKLRSIDEAPIKDIRKDFSDGLKLIKLLYALSEDTSLQPVHSRPFLSVQKMENVAVSLEFMKFNGLQLHNIGSDDIVEGNLKLLLGLIWTIISHYSIVKHSSDSKDRGFGDKRSFLLAWVQSVTSKYNVHVSNFSTSWNDGKALSALYAAHCSGKFQFFNQDWSDRKLVITTVLTLAEHELCIPKLIQPQDLLEVEPDEKSVMLYIVEWYMRFAHTSESSLGSISRSASANFSIDEPNTPDTEYTIDEQLHITKFVKMTESLKRLQGAFETRAEALVERIKLWIRHFETLYLKYDEYEKLDEIDTQSIDKLVDILVKERSNLLDFSSSEKLPMLQERVELRTLLSKIKIKTSRYAFAPYNPDITLHDIDNHWTSLLQIESTFSTITDDLTRNAQATVYSRFFSKVNEFQQHVFTQSKKLFEVLSMDSLEDQVEELKKLSEQIKKFDSLFLELSLLFEKLEKYHTAHLLTNMEYDECKLQFNELENWLTNIFKLQIIDRLKFIEEEYACSTDSYDIPDWQLNNCKQLFQECDIGAKGYLNKSEFTTCMERVFNDDNKLPVSEIHEIFESDINQNNNTLRGLKLEAFLSTVGSLLENETIELDKELSSSLQKYFKTLNKNAQGYDKVQQIVTELTNAPLSQFVADLERLSI
ncbi:hypothetical protein LJB42_002147 [Komagataella kurtzmanii]|nr:hypothetical protein LJB42_002147 [Komagataella kurtzmanii]